MTLEELGRVGVAGLSLPTVATRAGIHKTSLYRRWPTKDALVTAALGLAVPAPTALPDHGDLVQDLVALTRFVAGFVTSPAGLGVLRTLLADGDGPAVRRLARGAWQDPSRGPPRSVVTRAIARGELRADVDVDLLLHTLAGAVLHRTFVERKPADARWARRVVRLLCEGARAR